MGHCSAVFGRLSNNSTQLRNNHSTPQIQTGAGSKFSAFTASTLSSNRLLAHGNNTRRRQKLRATVGSCAWFVQLQSRRLLVAKFTSRWQASGNVPATRLCILGAEGVGQSGKGPHRKSTSWRTGRTLAGVVKFEGSLLHNSNQHLFGSSFVPPVTAYAMAGTSFVGVRRAAALR